MNGGLSGGPGPQTITIMNRQGTHARGFILPRGREEGETKAA